MGLGHLGGRLGLAGKQVREWSSWQLRLDGRGKGGGAACAEPLPSVGPFPSVGPGGRPLVGPRGVGSVPTDGEQECWPSLVQGE